MSNKITVRYSAVMAGLGVALASTNHLVQTHVFFTTLYIVSVGLLAGAILQKLEG